MSDGAYEDLARRAADAHRAASGERALRHAIGSFDTAVHNRVWTDPLTGEPRYSTVFVAGAPIHVKLHGVTNQFREDQADFLEKFVAGVHEELSKPEYRIRRSVELEKLVALRSQEDGVLRLIKAAADQVVQSAHTDAVIAGMRSHEGIVSGPAVTLASCHQALLVFVCPEADAVRRIREVRRPERKAAPEKVAVKMVLLRIRKLQTAVREINEHVKSNVESAAAGNRLLPQEMTLYMPAVPTEGGRDALTEYAASCMKHQGRRPEQGHFQELKKVLARPEVTDQVVEDAMRISQVEEVMES